MIVFACRVHAIDDGGLPVRRRQIQDARAQARADAGAARFDVSQQLPRCRAACNPDQSSPRHSLVRCCGRTCRPARLRTSCKLPRRSGDSCLPDRSRQPCAAKLPSPAQSGAPAAPNASQIASSAAPPAPTRSAMQEPSEAPAAPPSLAPPSPAAPPCASPGAGPRRPCASLAPAAPPSLDVLPVPAVGLTGPSPASPASPLEPGGDDFASLELQPAATAAVPASSAVNAKNYLLRTSSVTSPSSKVKRTAMTGRHRPVPSPERRDASRPARGPVKRRAQSTSKYTSSAV